ncbi:MULTISPECIES: hypothetical protein [Paenibacillus]|uniref:hypothetical protein n=1 Tax=Paenibacillus TaxID=44249 RepID=UPI0022B8EE62|nr:hypothetical protein [Paenibacillus caseinilyticus]MCZ8520419.1 hypothetical protein [Paenibacillus caseinilyticus]
MSRSMVETTIRRVEQAETQTLASRLGALAEQAGNPLGVHIWGSAAPRRLL